MRWPHLQRPNSSKPLKMRPVHCLQSLWIDHPVMQDYIPAENPQLSCCENMKLSRQTYHCNMRQTSFVSQINCKNIQLLIKTKIKCYEVGYLMWVLNSDVSQMNNSCFAIWDHPKHVYNYTEKIWLDQQLILWMKRTSPRARIKFSAVLWTESSKISPEHLQICRRISKPHWFV